jgi:hypothetical protein
MPRPALVQASRAVPALVALLGLVTAACGGPATPALTDPKLILEAGISGLQAAKTFHVDGTATGKLVLSLGPATGSGSGAPVVLDGSTIIGDADLAGKRAALSLAVPALFNVTADVVAVDGIVYTRVPLFGSGGWTRQAGAESTFDALADPAALLDGLAAFLGRPGVAPRTLSNERCDDTCAAGPRWREPRRRAARRARPWRHCRHGAGPDRRTAPREAERRRAARGRRHGQRRALALEDRRPRHDHGAAGRVADGECRPGRRRARAWRDHG